MYQAASCHLRQDDSVRAQHGIQGVGQLVADNQPAKGQTAKAEGPGSGSGRRRRLRLTAMLSALGTLVIVPLAVWAIETYGPAGVDALGGAGHTRVGASQGAGTPVTVVVQGEITGQGANFDFPRSRSLKPGPSAGCNNFLRWAEDHGGFLEASSDSLLVIVQGGSSQQAVIESIRPRILSEQPVPNGVVIQGCQHGKGGLPTYDLNFDLDRLTSAFQRAYSVSSTDSDVFNISAISQRYAYRWIIEMQVVQNGHVFTIDIRAPDGQPFTTTPDSTVSPKYYVRDDGVWLPSGPPSQS